jgi:hypothetical protein
MRPIVPGSLSKKVDRRVLADAVEFGGALKVSAQSSTFAIPQVGTVEPEGPTRSVGSVTVTVSVRSSIKIVFVIVVALAD